MRITPQVDELGQGYARVYLDVVKTTGTAVQTWLNLGHLPGGDGQFGSAEYGGGWVLSPDPIETCLSYPPAPAGGGLQLVELLVWAHVFRRLTGCRVPPNRIAGPDSVALRGLVADARDHAFEHGSARLAQVLGADPESGERVALHERDPHARVAC